MAEKFRCLGIKTKQEQMRVNFEKKSRKKGRGGEGNTKGAVRSNVSFEEALKKDGRCLESSLWVDVSDVVPRDSLGMLKGCLLGTWKT